MGYSNWSSNAYDDLRRSYAHKTRQEIFSAKGLHPALSPFGVQYRESRDSASHPESLAVQVYLDVTGSMGRIPELLVTRKLGSLMNTLLAHGVDHPQILFGAIGDQYSDQCPLQVSQFESGTEELNQWLTNIFLEGGGGGQQRESYQLAWQFAARHTVTDCFNKRGIKGFVFTIGDEWTWDHLSAQEIRTIFDEREPGGVWAGQLLQELMFTNHVFHIHINEGSYRNNPGVLEPWRLLLGNHFIVLNDYRTLAETIAVIIGLVQGIPLEALTHGFDRQTAGSVGKTLNNFKQNFSL